MTVRESIREAALNWPCTIDHVDYECIVAFARHEDIGFWSSWHLQDSTLIGTFMLLVAEAL